MTGRLRRTAGRARRTCWTQLQRVDPVRLALPPPVPGDGVAVVAVYRGRNAGVVRELLRPLPRATVRLWSLDGQVPDDLAPVTAGTGPGTRLELLDRLVAQVPAGQRRTALVLTDDDVRLRVGDLGRLVAAGGRAGLDVYQPAHLARSYSSWPITTRRALVVHREVDYVEQGPLVVLSAAAQAVLLPLPHADLDMGWGIEVRWWRAAERSGLRQGIVDAVGMEHLSPAGGAYDRDAQEAVLAREVATAGLTDIRDLHREHSRRWLWSRPRDGAGAPR